MRAQTVQLDIETERGWLANDTAAVRALHAGARVNMGDDRRPHLAVEAMMRMSAADLFVMGSSGFSGWAAVFGCGVKVGPWPGKSMGTPFSRRHVPFKNSLTTRVEPFARRALPALQVAWAEYVACRSDAACDLCGASHVHEPRWAQSPLARALVDDPRATQWQRPPLLPPTAAELAASGRGVAADVARVRAGARPRGARQLHARQVDRQPDRIRPRAPPHAALRARVHRRAHARVASLRQRVGSRGDDSRAEGDQGQGQGQGQGQAEVKASR